MIEKIFTHFNLDLDNILCIWLTQRMFPESLPVLVPANWVPDPVKNPEFSGVSSFQKAFFEGLLVVDIEAGGVGLKGQGSAFSSLVDFLSPQFSPEEIRVLNVWTRFSDAQDTGRLAEFLGGEEFLPRNPFSVGRLIAAYREKGGDQEILRGLPPILSLLFETEVAHLRLEKWANDLAGEEVVIVVIVKDGPRGGNSLLFERGVSFIVYSDGPNLGVVRRSDQSLNLGAVIKPLVERLAPAEAGEWFFHPAGFLAARGTFKAPAATHSSIDPNRIKEEIMKAISAL